MQNAAIYRKNVGIFCVAIKNSNKPLFFTPHVDYTAYVDYTACNSNSPFLTLS